MASNPSQEVPVFNPNATESTVGAEIPGLNIEVDPIGIIPQPDNGMGVIKLFPRVVVFP